MPKTPGFFLAAPSAAQLRLDSSAGEYRVAVYAGDSQDNTSLPETTTVNRAADCDEFLFLSGFE